MKTCSTCNTPKSDLDFYPNQARCKTCLCQSQREYRYANREKIAAKKRLYRGLNAAKIAAKKRAYQKSHAASIAARKARYWAQHREKLLRQKAAYRATRRSELAGKARAYYAASRTRCSEVNRNSQLRRIRALHPSYVRHLVLRASTAFSGQDIPPSIIILKTKLLKLKRQYASQ